MLIPRGCYNACLDTVFREREIERERDKEIVHTQWGGERASFHQKVTGLRPLVLLVGVVQK
jgi:hypothetical protein